MNKKEEVWDKLEKYLRSFDATAIAFSGGVDSSLLAAIAHKNLNKRAVAITALSAFISEYEHQRLLKVAEWIGINLHILKINVLDQKEVVANNSERCYFCKKAVFTYIRDKAETLGIRTVMDGTNVDDSSDYRPGRKALGELGVLSPFVKFEISKKMIREKAQELGLPVWDEPAAACLASRIPYETVINAENLQQVEKAEERLRELGLRSLRVRLHNDVARIEVAPEHFNTLLENREEIVADFKKFGIKFTCLDLTGYRTGSLNEVLKK